MKIRLGFVSNSSSSSFCLIGIAIPRYPNIDLCELVVKLGLITEEKLDSSNWPEDDAWEILYDSGYVIANHEEQGAPPEKTLVGVQVSKDDDYGLEANEVSLSEIIAKVEKIQEALGIIKPIRVYYGTKAT